MGRMERIQLARKSHEGGDAMNKPAAWFHAIWTFLVAIVLKVCGFKESDEEKGA